MGVRKNPDTGEIIVDPSRRPDNSRGGEPPTSPVGRPARRGADKPADPIDRPASTRSPGRAPDAGPSTLEAPTRPIGQEQRSGAAGTGERRTVLHRPGSRPADGGPGTAGADDAMADPVVGWLVVLAGPGKGQVRKLGPGTNSLGRGEKARVRLDFGDERISRENHAALTYDPRGRKYYLQHGGGVNLTYLGDQPVLTPTLLEAMQDICIGETTLRFVPFCGPDFDWQDLQDP